MWSLPLAAPILAAAYVLNAALELGVHWDSVVRPLVLSIAGAAVLTLIGVAVLRNRDRGGLFAVSVGIVVVGGGAIGTVLTKIEPWQAALWIALWAGAIGLAIRISRRQRWMRSVPRSSVLNTFAVAMLGTVLVLGTTTGRLQALAASAVNGQAVTSARTVQPDILLLILDGYPRADTLARIFGHDNAAFVNSLVDLGFDVADDAISNYAWTELTLLSMLSMHPVTNLAEFREGATTGRSQPWLRNLTDRNPVFDHLRDAGYRIVSISNNQDHTTLRGADVVYRAPGFTDFELHLLGATALAGMISIVDEAAFARNHRDQVLWGLETFEAVATASPGGRLVVGHVLSPHMPAVFNADGSLRVVPYDGLFYNDFRARSDIPRDEWNAAFRNQVAFLNQRVLEVLDTVVTENPEATIVVMSDHGSGSEYRVGPDGDVAERYATLLATRSPTAEDALADVRSPVNLFVALLNERLGLDLEWQPDTAWAGYLELQEVPESALR